MHDVSCIDAGGMRRLSLLESLRCSSAVAGDLALGSAASLDGPLPDVASLLQPVQEASSARPPLMLQNKLPRWNEGASQLRLAKPSSCFTSSPSDTFSLCKCKLMLRYDPCTRHPEQRQ